MDIYLAKPGGQKKGPFSLEEINRDLAACKYRDDEYWAWHEGLPQWMPLHMVPGITTRSNPAVSPAPVSHSEKVTAARPAPQVRTRTASTVSTPAPEEIAAEPAEVIAEVEPEALPVENTDGASGYPFPALEQIFIFTSGEGRAVFNSKVVIGKLQEAIGEELGTIRQHVPVDVVGRADLSREMPSDGAIPPKAWRAMTAIRPETAKKAKDDFYQICIRPLASESQESVAIFLLYNKEKLACAAA